MLAFLRDLARRARPFAERDFAELAAFARDRARARRPRSRGTSPYASEKLKAQRYAFSEQEVRQYFPEDRVLAGLFRVVETHLRRRDPRIAGAGLAPDVRFFDIRDRDGALVGQFYLDLYAREGKQGGAWMDDAINRRRVGDARAAPGRVPHLQPLGAGRDGRPATFTHDEVITLFHEFGHGLHQLLTRVDVAGVSGIQGVEWDAVELPEPVHGELLLGMGGRSQPMSAHVDTGAPLPRALFDKMLAAKNFQSGLGTLRQLEFALFDMLLHSAYDARRGGARQRRRRVLDAARREVAVVPRADYDRFMHVVRAHLRRRLRGRLLQLQVGGSAVRRRLQPVRGGRRAVAGGRRALPRRGARAGGSRPALESFVAFRGRTPQLDALSAA